MKYRALISATALLCSTIISSTAFATAVTPTVNLGIDANAPDEQKVCDDTYVNTQTDPTVWQAIVVNASAVATTPGPVSNTDVPFNYQADTTNPTAWSYVGFLGTSGTLTRNGGSPNLWAYATFDHSEWNNTLYDVQTSFSHNVTYTWTCRVNHYVDHPTFTPDPPSGDKTCPVNPGQGTPPPGGNGNGNEGCGLGNGGSIDDTPGKNPNDNSANTNSSSNSSNNGDNGCGAGGEGGTNDDIFAGNSDHVCKDGVPGTIHHHFTWDFDSDNIQPSVTNTGIDDGVYTTQVNVPQAGQVSGVNYLKESGPLTTNARILSCISPGSKGGSWKAKSYYLGGDTACAAAGKTFSTLGYGNGRNFDTPPTNSLPSQ